VNREAPLVSIGLPVFNGEDFVSQAIESILAQRFTDFELIISDNASTDGTPRICREYARRDPRVRYDRNATNLGGVRNFNLTFARSRGRYFKWAAHDDLLHPDFLARCVEVLESRPSVVLCSSLVRMIDPDDRVLRTGLDGRLRRVDSENLTVRLAQHVCVMHACYHIFGLMRSDVLRSTRLFGNYPGADRPLLAELALRGPMVLLRDDLLLVRDHPKRSIKALPSIYLRAQWHEGGKRRLAVFPHWKILLEYWRGVDHACLSRGARLRARLCVARSIFACWNWARLSMDLLVAVEPRMWVVHSYARRWYRSFRYWLRPPAVPQGQGRG
jgi:glycosyltransferase involved in cell wall biosynthesis